MQYLYKFSSINFTVNSLNQFLDQVSEFENYTNDSPNQLSFNQNDDFVNINNEVKNFQQTNDIIINKKQYIIDILNNFIECFEFLAKSLATKIDKRTVRNNKNELVVIYTPEVEFEYDKEQIKDYKEDRATTIANDFHFSKDQYRDFIKWLIENEEIHSLLLSYIGKNYKSINLQDVIQYNNNIIDFLDLEEEELEELNTLINSTEIDPKQKYSDIINFYQQHELNEVPYWIPEESLRKFLNSSSRDFDINELVLQWYMYQYKEQLEDDAEEYIYEGAVESIKDQCFDIEHRYGFNPFIVFKEKYVHSNQNDSRNTITLDNLFNDITELEKDFGYYCDYISTAYDYIYLRVINIKNIITQNKLDNFLICNANVDENKLVSITQNEQYKTKYGFIPENLIHNSPFLIDFFEKQKLIREKTKQKLQPYQATSTQEELNKLKDLNISNNPFEYSYKFDEDKFPGAGYWKMNGMHPFSIAINTNPKDLPEDLVFDLSLHSVQGERGLGWIGGFIDAEADVMYVNEIQSDIMQRTGNLSTNENHIQELKNNISKMEADLTLLNYVQQTDPRDILLNKIKQIEQEQLSATPQVIEKNKILLQRLYGQLNNIKDKQINTQEKYTNQKKRLIFNIEKIKNELKNIKIKDKDIFYTKDIRDKYYPYKNKIEKHFKDWYSIFFNIVLKEAKNRGFQELRLISAKDLMRVWVNHVSDETISLFERIYDNTAQKYNATKIKALSYDWWSIPINENVKIAKYVYRYDKSS